MEAVTGRFNVLELITPYVEKIILVVVPIYMVLGEVFANLGILFLGFLSDKSIVVPLIIMGVFIVLGILGGIMGKSPEEKRDKSSYTPSAGKPPESAYDF